MSKKQRVAVPAVYLAGPIYPGKDPHEASMWRRRIMECVPDLFCRWSCPEEFGKHGGDTNWVASEDIKALSRCQAVVAYLDNAHDHSDRPGTCVEIGWAKGRDMPICLLSHVGGDSQDMWWFPREMCSSTVWIPRPHEPKKPWWDDSTSMDIVAKGLRPFLAKIAVRELVD